jgi:hypothetical protein
LVPKPWFLVLDEKCLNLSDKRNDLEQIESEKSPRAVSAIFPPSQIKNLTFLGENLIYQIKKFMSIFLLFLRQHGQNKKYSSPKKTGKCADVNLFFGKSDKQIKYSNNHPNPA